MVWYNWFGVVPLSIIRYRMVLHNHIVSYSVISYLIVSYCTTACRILHCGLSHGCTQCNSFPNCLFRGLEGILRWSRIGDILLSKEQSKGDRSTMHPFQRPTKREIYLEYPFAGRIQRESTPRLGFVYNPWLCWPVEYPLKNSA